MSWINFIVNNLGSSVCHQIPERSLEIGGLILPVCSRCCGIYIGFFICAIFMFLTFRKRESDPPPLYIIIILIVFVLSTAVDGLLSYFSVIETNNIARFVTGFLSGSSAMVFIYPIFNYQYYRNPSDKRVFSSPLRFVIFIAVNAVIILVTLLKIGFLGYFYYYLSAFSIIFTFYFVNLVLFFLVPVFSRKAEKLFSKHLILPTILALIMSSAEIFVSYKFHLFIINF